MTKNLIFSAFGRDSYYHREWFKKHGFKFDRSSRKWTVYANHSQGTLVQRFIKWVTDRSHYGN